MDGAEMEAKHSKCQTRRGKTMAWAATDLRVDKTELEQIGLRGVKGVWKVSLGTRKALSFNKMDGAVAGPTAALGPLLRQLEW